MATEVSCCIDPQELLVVPFLVCCDKSQFANFERITNTQRFVFVYRGIQKPSCRACPHNSGASILHFGKSFGKERLEGSAHARADLSRGSRCLDYRCCKLGDYIIDSR